MRNRFCTDRLEHTFRCSARCFATDVNTAYMIKCTRYIHTYFLVYTLTVFVFEWHVCVDNVALLFKNYIFQIFPQGSSQPPSQQPTLQPTGEDSEHSHHFTIQVRPFVFHVDFYIVILTIWFTLTRYPLNTTLTPKIIPWCTPAPFIFFITIAMTFYIVNQLLCCYSN